MEHQNLLSRAQLASRIGVEEQPVAFWIREGLLPSVENQPRKHKRFDKRGAKIAILLRELRDKGANVGMLREVVAGLNSAVALYEEQPKIPLIWDAIGFYNNQKYDLENGYETRASSFTEMMRDRTASGRVKDTAYRSRYEGDPRYEHYLKHGRHSDQEIEAADRAGKAFPLERLEEFYLGAALQEANEVLVIYRDEHGRLQLRVGLPGDGKLPAASIIALDLQRLFAEDWLAGLSQ